MQTARGLGTLRAGAVVPLWERSLNRCAAFCTALARLDIDERITRINIATAKGIAGEVNAVLERIFRRLNVDTSPDWVRSVIAEEFRRLAEEHAC